MKGENNSQSNIELIFNTEPLLNDLNNVIQIGVNKLLSKYITNYKLYEETHNCIMNLPSVKMEIAKKNEVDETYDDLPDLISISSDSNSEEYTDYFNVPLISGIDGRFCGNFNEPIEKILKDYSDKEEEFEDTILSMKKMLNDLLKEKEERDLFNKKQEENYKKIIETYDKEISDLKNQLNNCVKECELTVEKELEQESVQEEEEEPEPVQEEEQESVQEEEKEPELVQEEEEEPDQEEEPELEQEKENIILHIEEEEFEEDLEEEEEEKLSEDEVETEKSASDEEEEEEEEEELIEIEIDNVTYCTNDEDNGFIYELDKDGNVGETIGYLKDGEPFFN